MTSITKTKVTKDEITKMVHRAFGKSPVIQDIEELKDGYFNSAYRIRFEDGFSSVLKVAPRGDIEVMSYEGGLMKTEVEFLKLCSQREEIPVPALHFQDFTREVYPCDYFFMEEILGRPWSHLKESLSPEENQGIQEELGRVTRGINSLTSDQFGYFDDLHSTWREAFESMLENLLRDGEYYGVSLPLESSVIRDRVGENLGYLEDINQASLVHWDLWEGNVLIREDQKCLSGIIDCERAFWGDPLAEFNFSFAGYSPAFGAGYGKDMLTTESQQRRRLLYNVYWLMIMVIESVPRQYEDQGITQWAYGELKKQLEQL